MSAHAYRPQAIRGDYIRAGAGLAMTALPLTAVPPASIAGIVLTAAALLFAGFGARTWVRQKSRFHVDEKGIARDGPFGTMLPWAELTALRLRYFATKRDRSGGWMQMTLKGENGAMRIDSTLEGFRDLAGHALRTAESAGIALDRATVENLRALGLRPDGEDAWPTC
jgi:hypothetical protein